MRATGGKDFHRLADDLAALPRDLRREFDKADHQAAQVVVDEVNAHTKDYIPQGFEARWDQSARSKTEVKRGAVRHVSIAFWGAGKRGRRDIQAINAGKLKHPVYGRYRRLKDGTLQANPWVSSPPQPIRPGLVTEPAARAMPRAVQKYRDATRRVVDKMGRS